MAFNIVSEQLSALSSHTAFDALPFSELPLSRQLLGISINPANGRNWGAKLPQADTRATAYSLFVLLM